MSAIHYSKVLADFAATLKPADIPEEVMRRGEDLLVDWFGSAVAGKGAAPVEILTRFVEQMGPNSGPSEILVHRSSSSP
jgi:2-methylcitrate dehydratase PrpD